MDLWALSFPMLSLSTEQHMIKVPQTKLGSSWIAKKTFHDRIVINPLQANGAPLFTFFPWKFFLPKISFKVFLFFWFFVSITLLILFSSFYLAPYLFTKVWRHSLYWKLLARLGWNKADIHATNSRDSSTEVETRLCT